MDAIQQMACRVLVRSLLLVSLLWCAQADAQDAVLMASTVPGHRVGMPVSLGDRLSVPEGGSIALLFRSGQVLRLGGPLETVLEMPSGSRRDSLAVALGEVFRLRGVDASVIGATRAGVAPASARPRDVDVDPMLGETWCLGPADRIWLHRATAREAGEWVLSRGRMRRYLTWPAEADRIAWPEDVPVGDGDAFELSLDGTTLGRLTFQVVAQRPDDDPAQIAEGVLRGCRHQYEEALGQLARRMLDR